METKARTKQAEEQPTKNTLDELIGRRIRLRRQNLAYSQEKLGNMVGLTFQQIQKYESGKNRISASRLWEFSKVLEIPIDYFFTDLKNEVSQSEKYSNSELYSEKTMLLINAYNSISNKDLAEKFFRLLMSVSSRYISKDEK